MLMLQRMIVLGFIIGVYFMNPTLVRAEDNIPKEAKEYYLIGKRHLSNGCSYLAKGREMLDNAFKKNDVSVPTLRTSFEEKFEDTRIPLTDFFHILYKKYRYEEIMLAKSLFQDASKELVSAREAFDKASQCSQDFVEAYLYNCLACLKMGWDKEAIISFKQAAKIGVNRLRLINPLSEEIRDIFYEIALISSQLPDKEGVGSSENIIGTLTTIQCNQLNKLIEDAFDDEQINKLKNEQMKSMFELTRFYLFCKNKEQANISFITIHKTIKDNLANQGDIYQETIRDIESLEEEIKKIHGLTELTLKIDEDVVTGFEPVVRLKMVNASKKKAECNDLYLYLFPEGSGIEFRNEWIYPNITKDERISVPVSEYDIQINISNVGIIEKDKMPVALILENQKLGWINEKSIKLQPEVSLELQGNITEECATRLKANQYIYDMQEGFIINRNTGQRVKLANGSLIKKMILPEQGFLTQEGRGEYILTIAKLGNWIPTGKKDVNMAKGGMGIMAFLFLMMR
ncbi:hypothetical protein KKG56_01360 [bacterium]|nr:hypothetical protein [bacterium]